MTKQVDEVGEEENAKLYHTVVAGNTWSQIGRTMVLR